MLTPYLIQYLQKASLEMARDILAVLSVANNQTATNAVVDYSFGPNIRDEFALYLSIIGYELIPLLKAKLSSPFHMHRLVAAYALQGMPRPNDYVLNSLGDNYGDYPQFYVFTTTFRYETREERETKDLLTLMLYDQNDAVFSGAVEGIARMGHTSDEIVKLTLDRFHENPTAEIGEKITTIQDDRIIDHFVKLVEDTNPETSATALKSLRYNKKADRAIPTIMLKYDSYDCGIYEVVLDILGNSSYDGAISNLAQDYYSNRCGQKDRIMLTISYIAERTRSKKAISVFLTSFGEKYSDSKIYAASSIAAIMGAGAEMYLSPLLDSADIKDRELVLNLLLRFRSNNGYNAALKYLKDTNVDREYVLSRLALYGYEEGLPYIEKNIMSPDYRNRTLIIGYLRRHESIKAHEMLIDGLSSQYHDVRQGAVQILGFKRSYDSIYPLIERIKDPVVDIRYNAADALYKITGVRMPPDYEMWIDWWRATKEKYEHAQ